MRIVFIFIIAIILGGCTRNRHKEELAKPTILFYESSFQDSLEHFINTIDSFPNTSIAPEFLIQFSNSDEDTLIVMAANINITPSWELNSLPKEINKHFYRPEGGIYINDKPILIRTTDNINISNIIDISCLNQYLGNTIDSLTVETRIEPWGIATYKLYKIDNADSLILLQNHYLGHRILDMKRYDRFW